MAEREIEVGEPRVVMRGERAAGVVAAVDGEEGGLRTALETAGYQVVDLEDAEDVDDLEEDGEAGRIRLDEECTDEHTVPCDLATALGVAHELAEELALPSHGTLKAIVDSGVTSVAEARSVLTRWASEVRSAPAADVDALGWAEVVESEVFGREPGPTKG